MDAAALDKADPLAAKRDEFIVPEGLIYLDGNSLGCLPRHVPERMADVVAREWGESLIRGWNAEGWMDLPMKVGARIGKLIGAAPGTVVAADTTSINLVKALSAGLSLRPGRKVILSDTGNFPADLYMAQGLIRTLAKGHELRLVAPEDVEGAIDESVAVIMLTQADYRTSRIHDMARLTAKAHTAGAIAQWDLCHSAGAFPVDLSEAKADFAIGCTYKYLNGGPGAPAFIYVRPDHLAHVEPMLSGWMGHEAPFAFDLDYRPAPGTERMTVGTPPVLALSALDAAMDVWDGVDMTDVRKKSKGLTDLFIEEVERRCANSGLTLASPRDANARGSQVSFHCADGYAVMQALIARGVIGDFRAPDIMRFGFAPLYLRYWDVVEAAVILEDILKTGAWRALEFGSRARVT